VIQGTFEVGNLNDYINIINKTNVFENSNLSTDDFLQLEHDHSGEKLSYKVMSTADDKAIKTFKVNNNQFLNVYNIV
jgi:hypothetical protein